MLNNKKGFQLSINMIVVIILGLTMMGIGITIFFNAYDQTVDLRERVDSQTERQLTALLDTGEAVIIPINNKDAERGEWVDFDLAISNELNYDKEMFYLFIRFDEFIGNTNLQFNLDARPIDGIGLDGGSVPYLSCRLGDDKKNCADSWVLIFRESVSDSGHENDKFQLLKNEKHIVPIRIALPRRITRENGDSVGLPTGQYVFNVDVFVSSIDLFCTLQDSEYADHDPTNDDCVRYFSRKKLYVNVN